jgi:O-antigen/teichoic acid export membrane protein
MQREKRLAVNTMILSLGTVLPRLASFITLPIYTMALTMTEYGAYDLIAILASLAAPAVTLQIQAAAFRFLIGEKDNRVISEIISNVFFFLLPVSLLSFIAVFALLFSLSPYVRLLISLYLFFEIFIVMMQQIIRGMGKNKEYAISAMVNTGANVLLAPVFLLWLKWGLAGLLISLSCAFLFTLIYISFQVKIARYIRFSLIGKNCLRSLIKYSFPLVPNALSLWIVRVSDRLLLTAFIGIESAAVYAVANKIPQLISITQNTLGMAWQESASIAKDDSDSLSYFSRVFHFQFYLLGGVTALLLGFSPVLFSLLVRGQYGEAYMHMPILYMAIMFYGVSSYYAGIYAAHKQTRQVAISTVLAALINIAVGLAMISRYGIYAATVSTLASYLFLALYRMNDTKKLRKITYEGKKMTGMIALLLAACALFYIDNLPAKAGNMFLGIVIAALYNSFMIKAALRMIKRKFIR